MNVYYRDKSSRLIAAKFIGCDTTSTVFRDTKLYERFESPHDLPLETEPPYSPVALPKKSFLQSPNKDLWEITVADDGKLKFTQHPYLIGENERANNERFAEIMTEK